MGIFAKFPRLFAMLAIGLLAFGQAHAQASRTWVSGVGDDINPCSRTAPCKTFNGAISKTAPGGVIGVLDPGGFGAVAITKSITLENVGAIASVLVSGTTGIIVNAPGGAVTLRGLSFQGLGTGINGIDFLGGSALIVEGCDIDAFNNAGINFAPTSAATLMIRDTTIHNSGNVANPNTTGGVVISPGSGGSVNAVLDHVRILNSIGFGLQARGPASVIVSDSQISTNAGNGIWALASSSTANLMLDRVVISGNSSSGVVAQGVAALIRLTDSTITDNTQGIRSLSGGAVVSFGNNRNLGNIVNGAPTATSPQQ